MRAESRWAVEEIDEWAASQPLVDRAMIHDGLILGDGTWEPVFNGLTVPTLLVAPTDSPMAPDPALIRVPVLALIRAQVPVLIRVLALVPAPVLIRAPALALAPAPVPVPDLAPARSLSLAPG